MGRIRVAVLARDGSDVDDAAIILAQHVRHPGPAGQKRGRQVHLDHLAPHCRIELPDGRIAARDAGVVDQGSGYRSCQNAPA
jgi:hypothetical protein